MRIYGNVHNVARDWYEGMSSGLYMVSCNEDFDMIPTEALERAVHELRLCMFDKRFDPKVAELRNMQAAVVELDTIILARYEERAKK